MATPADSTTPRPPTLGGAPTDVAIVPCATPPEIAPTVTTVVLGAVVIFEIAGPLSARFALDRTGESRPQDEDPLMAEV